MCPGMSLLENEAVLDNCLVSRYAGARGMKGCAGSDASAAARGRRCRHRGPRLAREMVCRRSTVKALIHRMSENQNLSFDLPEVMPGAEALLFTRRTTVYAEI